MGSHASRLLLAAAQMQQRAPRQQLGDMRSAPRQQLSSSAACTSAATRRLGDMRSAPRQQLSSSAACTSAATRRHAISSVHLGSNSATCDMRLPAAPRRHATCAFWQHFSDMRLAPSRCTTTVHSLKQQFHLERAMCFFVLSLFSLSLFIVLWLLHLIIVSDSRFERRDCFEPARQEPAIEPLRTNGLRCSRG